MININCPINIPTTLHWFVYVEVKASRGRLVGNVEVASEIPKH